MDPDLKDHRPVFKLVTIESGCDNSRMVGLGIAMRIGKIDEAVFRKTGVYTDIKQAALTRSKYIGDTIDWSR
jgi:hypothetical protein